MSNIFMVKGFNLDKSESLLLSVAKVYEMVFILETRSIWNLYCFAICESGKIFLNNGSYLLAIVQQSANCFQQ